MACPSLTKWTSAVTGAIDLRPSEAAVRSECTHSGVSTRAIEPLPAAGMHFVCTTASAADQIACVATSTSLMQSRRAFLFIALLDLGQPISRIRVPVKSCSGNRPLVL